MTFRLYRIKLLFSAAVLILAGVVAAACLIPIGTVTAAAGNKLGDANSDGQVNVDDVSCIQKTLAGLPVSGVYSKTAADADGSGVVDITDATIIQRWLLGADTPYQIGTEPTETYTHLPTDAEGWGRDIYKP